MCVSVLIKALNIKSIFAFDKIDKKKVPCPLISPLFRDQAGSGETVTVVGILNALALQI